MGDISSLRKQNFGWDIDKLDIQKEVEVAKVKHLKVYYKLVFMQLILLIFDHVIKNSSIYNIKMVLFL